MGLTKEQKVEIFNEYGGKDTNTGSPQSQVAMFTRRINDISQHLKTNKKDYSSQRSLLKLVGERKRLLKYLSNTDLEAYRGIIDKLKLRK